MANKSEPEVVVSKGDTTVHHRIWLILTITIILLAVAFVVFFPTLKETFAGEAVKVSRSGFQAKNLVAIPIDSPATLGGSCTQDSDCSTGEVCQKISQVINAAAAFRQPQLPKDAKKAAQLDLTAINTNSYICISSQCNSEITSGALSSFAILKTALEGKDTISNDDAFCPFSVDDRDLTIKSYEKFAVRFNKIPGGELSHLCMIATDSSQLGSFLEAPLLGIFAGKSPATTLATTACASAPWFPHFARNGGFHYLYRSQSKDNALTWLKDVKFSKEQPCLHNDDCKVVLWKI